MSRGSVGPSTTNKYNSGKRAYNGQVARLCQRLSLTVLQGHLQETENHFICNETENQNKVLVQPLKVVEGEYEPSLLSNKPFGSLLTLIWLLPIPKRQVPKSAYME